MLRASISGMLCPIVMETFRSTWSGNVNSAATIFTPSLSLSLSLSVSLSLRTGILPYTLTPHLITPVNFINAGTTRFSATIRIGTGEYRSLRLSRSTIVSNATSLSYIAEEIEFILLYGTAWYRPYSKLCSRTIAFDELCTELYRQGQAE